MTHVINNSREKESGFHIIHMNRSCLHGTNWDGHGSYVGHRTANRRQKRRYIQKCLIYLFILIKIVFFQQFLIRVVVIIVFSEKNTLAYKHWPTDITENF